MAATIPLPAPKCRNCCTAGWGWLRASFLFGGAQTLLKKKGRLEKGQSEIDLSDIMQVSVGHLGVLTTMSDLLGPEMPCPSPYPQPHLVLPAKILEALGTALKPVGSAFSIIMADNLWNNRFAYDHCKKQLIEIDPVAKELTGRSIESIPSQVGDSVSVPPPGGNFYQADLVTGASVLKKKGKRTVRSFRSESVCAKTEYCAIVLETDTHNTVALQAWCNIMCNIPELCFSVVDTGNRSPHWVFIVPRARKKELQRRVGDMMRMLGNDNSGWSNCKITRLGNTGRGIARDDKPAMQTLIWFSPIPSHLDPNRSCQTWNDFEALFEKSVLANKESIEAECVKMEATIANLRLLTVGDNKQIPPMTTRTASTNRSTATTASTGGSNSPKMELRGLSGGKAFQYVRHALREQLSAAGDKLELSPEAHAALASEVAKECGLELDDAEGIVDKVCATPHWRHPAGKSSLSRPYKNVDDEEFVGPLNFHYPASFWATEECRLLFQKTEECYVEFAFTALVLHRLCGINRADLLKWLQSFYENRPNDPVNTHIEVPGQINVSDRVREVTERVLPSEQAKKLLACWECHYGCESDMNELLATMAKHLAEADLDLWDWVDEDLYRLEEKFWTREKAKCGGHRLTCIIAAIESIFAGQLQTSPSLTPKVTTEMILDWITAHSEHGFKADSANEQKAREAKLTSILRGLRMLVTAECLREVPNQGEKRKEAVFEPGISPLPRARNREITNVRYRHTVPCIKNTLALHNTPITRARGGTTTPKNRIPAASDSQENPKKSPETQNPIPSQPQVEITTGQTTAQDNPSSGKIDQSLQPVSSQKHENRKTTAVKPRNVRMPRTTLQKQVKSLTPKSSINPRGIKDPKSNKQEIAEKAAKAQAKKAEKAAEIEARKKARVAKVAMKAVEAAERAAEKMKRLIKETNVPLFLHCLTDWDIDPSKPSKWIIDGKAVGVVGDWILTTCKNKFVKNIGPVLDAVPFKARSWFALSEWQKGTSGKPQLRSLTEKQLNDLGLEKCEGRSEDPIRMSDIKEHLVAIDKWRTTLRWKPCYSITFVIPELHRMAIWWVPNSVNPDALKRSGDNSGGIYQAIKNQSDIENSEVVLWKHQQQIKARVDENERLQFDLSATTEPDAILVDLIRRGKKKVDYERAK